MSEDELARIVADLPRLAEEATHEQAPRLLGALERTKWELVAKVAGTQRDNGNTRGQDRLLDVKEAAKRLSVTVDWLYRNASKLPFSLKIGNLRRFSSDGIDKFIRTRKGR